MLNEKVLKYLGFNPQLQGRGLKIAVFEYYPSSLFYIHDVKNPLNANWGDINKIEDDQKNHPYMTSSYWKTSLPLLEVFYLPQNDQGVQWAIDNGVHIATFSAEEMLASNELEKKLAEKTFLISSAGNFLEARNIECWWATSALHLSDSGELYLPYYMNYTSSKIKSISLSNIQYEEGSPLVDGTSFANVTLGILVAQYYEVYHLKFGFYPTIEQTKAFILLHSKKVINDVLKEGNGLFVLPPNLMTDYNFGTVVSEKYGNKINVNGVWQQTVNSPMIVNNKLMVELTVLRSCNGNKVYWNDKEKCAIISK